MQARIKVRKVDGSSRSHSGTKLAQLVALLSRIMCWQKPRIGLASIWRISTLMGTMLPNLARNPAMVNHPSAADSGIAQCQAPRGSAPALAALDQRRIAIHLVAQGRERVLRGIGAYGSDPSLGGVLRVAIRDEAGPYDLLFVDGQWRGRIESGEALGCDYLMHVG